MIAQKNTNVDNRQVLDKKVTKTEYGITYTTAPGKTCLIEPHGGAIDYDLAKKNPNAFYDNVFNQDLTKHRVISKKEKKPAEG